MQLSRPAGNTVTCSRRNRHAARFAALTAGKCYAALGPYGCGCRRVKSPIGRIARQDHAISGMTAIDFTSFVDQLASVSGETILPFFRTALAIENKKAGRLRSGHRRRPRRGRRHARAHPQELSRPRHPRRGIRRRAHRRRICLGARPDRRHQVLHHRHGGLGHADRPDAVRRAGVRHDAPAVHARALLRRRRRGALSRTGGQPRSARARLRDA